MEIVNSYLNEIIFWCATFISGLAGVGISVGACAKSVLNVLNLLKGTKGNYEDAISKVSEFSVQLDAITTQLLETQSALNQTLTMYNNIMDENLALKKALGIIASNDSSLITSGVADEVKEVLGLKEEKVEQVEIDE